MKALLKYAVFGLLVLSHSDKTQAQATNQGGVLEAIDKQLKKLQDDMQAQTAQINQLKSDIIVLNDKISNFSISVGPPQPEGTFGGAGRWGPAGIPFWTSEQDTSVSYTCPGKEVLAGMTFIMHSDGVGRHPSWVQYICKTLGP